MNKLIEFIREQNWYEAKRELIEQLDNERMSILEEYSKWLTSKGMLDEASRYKIVRVRIRRGKIQRRKKVSTVKGYTMRGGKVTRMSNLERRNRRVSQRRGKIKRAAKQSRARVNTRKSMRKLKAIGGKR